MLERKNISDHPIEYYKRKEIAAVTYAEGGANGTPGEVILYVKDADKMTAYEGNTLFQNPSLKELIKLLPILKSFFEEDKLTSEWGYTYLGMGHHLFLKTPLYEKLKRKYETMDPTEIYMTNEKDILNICQNYEYTKPFTLLEETRGDITKINYTDAIVNAANSSLLGGGGVDGAIHRAAGIELLKECKTLHGCETGEAKITKAYHIPTNYVIHTVGPRYLDGTRGEERKLRNCYLNSLKLAEEYQIRSIAFPSISTGIYGYPVEAAAKVAVKAVADYTREHPGKIDVVTWVLFDEHTRAVYEKAIQEALRGN